MQKGECQLPAEEKVVLGRKGSSVQAEVAYDIQLCEYCEKDRKTRTHRWKTSDAQDDVEYGQ